MKQFVIKAYDGKGKLDKRMEVRPRHFEGMEKMKEHILCAGGMLDDDGKMIGSLLVMEFETEQLIKEVCADEPYSKGTVEAVAWKLANVINRHLHEGDKVRLKDFGLMKLEIESDKVDVPEDFKPSKHIKGVRLHFLPESAKGRPELYKKIKFEK